MFISYNNCATSANALRRKNMYIHVIRFRISYAMEKEKR